VCPIGQGAEVRVYQRFERLHQEVQVGFAFPRAKARRERVVLNPALIPIVKNAYGDEFQPLPAQGLQRFIHLPLAGISRVFIEQILPVMQVEDGIAALRSLGVGGGQVDQDIPRILQVWTPDLR